MPDEEERRAGAEQLDCGQGFTGVDRAAHALDVAGGPEASRQLVGDAAELDVGDRPVAIARMGPFTLLDSRRWQRSDARRHLGLPESGPIVLFFGNARPNKGLDLLMGATPRLLALRPDAHVYVSTTAWLAVAGLAGAYALRRLATWVRLRSMAVIGEYVARDLRAELYAHLGKLSVNFYSKKKTGTLITRVSSDTDRLWEFLALSVVDVSLSVVMLVGLSTVLIYLDQSWAW